VRVHKLSSMILAAAVVCYAVVAQAITIETVPVGDLGNAADATGYGSVGYAYNIGKYEVTAGQYTAFLNAVGGVDTYGLYNSAMSNTSYGSGIARSGGGIGGNPYIYTVDANFINRPVDYVSWGDSTRFANWLHNGQPTGAQDLSTTEDGAYYLNGATTDAAILAVSRKADWKWAITSEDEWYKSAYYKGGSISAGYWDYPTSSDTAPGRDMADASGNNANCIGAPFPIDSGKFTTLVGEFQNSASPYGTFDQGGNVWEWNEAVQSGAWRGYRAGSYTNDSGSQLASYRIVYYPKYEHSAVGFRVASVPEPGSIIMLLGLALTALLYSVRKHV
jgi:formylglycine-generating enzyme